MQRTFSIDYSSRSRYRRPREARRPATHVDADADPLRPARGVFHGVLAGAALWALLIVAYWFA
jgi:hypothetical protein